MIEEFLRYIESEKRYSKLTKTAYGDYLRQFLTYYGVDEAAFDPAEVTPLDLRIWLIVPLVPRVAERLKKYSVLRSEICKSDNNFLILSDEGENISRSEVYRTVREVLTAMGVEGKRSPHVLRHTFATHLMSEGAGIETVKELLGHANLSTTQIYTHSTIKELIDAYRSAHPRSRKVR